MTTFIFGMLVGAFLGAYASAWMNAYREWDESDYNDDWEE